MKMDNPLTPNKIQRLMHLAEDKSFNMTRRLLVPEELLRRTSNQGTMNKTANCEASSGLLDLERIEGFGESEIGDLSLSKSTAFNPGEMTGRSTGADDMNTNLMSLGRHSLALESLTSQMDKQTSEIQDIMRHSIATNYSFQSKRDLTADEASFVAREGRLPIQNITHTNFTETSLNNSNLSMGAYFKNRCPEFAKILSKTESPDRSGMPSITEVSAAISESIQSDKNQMHRMDQTLDCVPVRQPRNNLESIIEKQNLLKSFETQNNFAASKVEKQNQPSCSNANKQEMFYMSQVPDKPKYVQMNLNHVSPVECKPMANAGPDNDFIMKLQHSLRLMSGDDTGGSAENSLSISKIADYLGKQSNVSVTDMLLYNNQKKQLNRKQPLSELHMNIPGHKNINQDVQVTHLKDTKRTETASSSGTANTVINKFQSNEPHVPEVVVTQDTIREDQNENDDNRSKKTVRSKSPSSKSHSTLSTVHENFISFKSSNSPLHSSKGEANTSHVASPNIVYKELDKSVDWDAVMQQKHLKQEGMATEQWAEILTTAARGYVGVSTPVTVTITTLSDSWLTARLQFDDVPNKDISIELPRQPLLLSPGKSERITLNITSNIELQTTLRFTVYLKDASIDGDIEQKGDLEVNMKLPVIQAMSCDGINKITFPPIQEKACLVKSFVLISDCPEDLQLVLSVVEGDSMFAITAIQEIKKADVNKVLMDRQASPDDNQQQGKLKNKAINKQLCRLACGNAIRVTIKFSTPKLCELQITEPIVTFNGTLNVNLIGVNTVLRKVNLIGIVGTVNLVVNAPASKLQVSQETVNIDLCNSGSISGIWMVKFVTNSPTESFPFKIAPSKFEIRPGGTKTVSLSYLGSGDGVYDATLIFEEIASGNKTTLEISGGADRPKVFPIKTNYNTMSWVRSGRRELSLKNSSNKKIYIRCQIVGEGFTIDLPRESRGVYSVAFGPCECRPLPIIFMPSSNIPHAATLHIVYDKNSDFSRKVSLFGCASGEAVRWSGLVTYGDTALVRAAARAPVCLELYNKAPTPAFVCARVHFNLQYMCVGGAARGVAGGRRVVGGRARHALQLRLDWPRLERRAREAAAPAALATLTVLTGAEFTRRRILKIVRDESNGELDTSLLPDHLKVLADKYEGEDPSMDNMLRDFKETKASLNELIGGLHELTAQIDLPQDFTDENTIIISDDTVIEHHTLCD